MVFYAVYLPTGRWVDDIRHTGKNSVLKCFPEMFCKIPWKHLCRYRLATLMKMSHVKIAVLRILLNISKFFFPRTSLAGTSISTRRTQDQLLKFVLALNSWLEIIYCHCLSDTDSLNWVAIHFHVTIFIYAFFCLQRCPAFVEIYQSNCLH